MQNVFKQQTVADNVDFYSIRDGKFKHNRISMHLVLPLYKKTVTDYAILPFIMRKGYKGCEDFSKLNAMLDELYGASLIAEVGKFGANQVLIFSIQAIDERFTLNDEKIISKCANLLSDVVLNPNIVDGRFPENDVELEKQFLIDTITAEINDKRSYAIGRCKLLMGEDNPASIRKYGYVEDAANISPASAAKAYQEAISKANIKIMFVGSGSSDAAYQVFLERFSKAQRQPITLNPIKYFDPPKEPKEVTELMDINQAKLVLGFRTPLIEDPLKLMAMKLMVVLYGGTPASKLFMNVREKLSLCYYCAARFDKMTGIMMVDSGVEFANIELAKQEIINQLNDIKNGVISEDELNSAKLMVKNSLRSVTDSLGSVEEWYLLQSLLETNETPTDGFKYIDKISLEMISDAAKGVTLDTIYLLSSSAASAK